MDRRAEKNLIVANVLCGLFYAAPLFLLAGFMTTPNIGTNPDSVSYTWGEWGHKGPKTFHSLLPFLFGVVITAFCLNGLFLFEFRRNTPHALEASLKMALLAFVIACCSVFFGSMLSML